MFSVNALSQLELIKYIQLRAVFHLNSDPFFMNVHCLMLSCLVMTSYDSSHAVTNLKAVSSFITLFSLLEFFQEKFPLTLRGQTDRPVSNK